MEKWEGPAAFSTWENEKSLGSSWGRETGIKCEEESRQKRSPGCFACRSEALEAHVIKRWSRGGLTQEQGLKETEKGKGYGYKALGGWTGGSELPGR